MARPAVEYVTCRAIAKESAEKKRGGFSVSVDYTEYLRRLLELYLAGRRNQTLRIYVSHSPVFYRADELKREVFWTLFSQFDCMPPEIRQDQRTPPPTDSPLWHTMASIDLSEFRDAATTTYLDRLLVCTKEQQKDRERRQDPVLDLRDFVMRNGPPWLGHWLGARSGQPPGSHIDEFRGWLSREVNHAEKAGRMLKKMDTFSEAKDRFSGLTTREFDHAWKEVPADRKFWNRPRLS
jgi:hypothetical protein